LGWRPRYDAPAAVEASARWYAAWRDGGDLRAVTREQLQVVDESLSGAMEGERAAEPMDGREQ
jgi:hypothetical protein